MIKSELTDYDICELYIRCVSTFVERCTKMELESGRSFELGNKLWKETIEILAEYRKEHSDSKDSNR